MGGEEEESSTGCSDLSPLSSAREAGPAQVSARFDEMFASVCLGEGSGHRVRSHGPHASAHASPCSTPRESKPGSQTLAMVECSPDLLGLLSVVGTYGKQIG